MIGTAPDQAGREVLLDRLRDAVGSRNVLTTPEATEPFRTGFRFGGGPALAVVQPSSLVQLWRALQACVEANAIVIMQAANTGLNGGSTPAGDDYNRDLVIISPMAIDRIHIIAEGQQVICLPGATLYQLEAALRPFGREPHSVIGSSCIGASVVGGICNNSGGALVRRGPAYTELALYAQVDATGQLRLINHLGLELGSDPEAMLARLESGAFSKTDIIHDQARRASDSDYQRRVRDIEAATPARFNADPGRLFEGAGCGGKLVLFAVRLDTFEKDDRTAVFYIGTNDPEELTVLRRDILRRFTNLPVAGEYMHRDCFDIAAQYGKDTFLAIRALGTDRLPGVFRLKTRIDRLAAKLGLGKLGFSDRWMQRASRIFPAHLPRSLCAYRDRYEHYLILKMEGDGIEEAAKLLSGMFPSASGDFFRCTEQEGAAAFLHRFAAAGAAVRYRLVHTGEVEDIVALDIALPRNTDAWFERLPDEIAEPIIHKLYYGHFFCQVFHQDYIVRRGTDPVALEHRMWALLDERGAEYPAEHNVGHLYRAKPALADFYRSLDPTNCLNPGIGKTSKHRDWR